MAGRHLFSSCVFILITICAVFTDASSATAQDDLNVPIVKFFYYNEDRIEWVLSNELDRFEEHLLSDPKSERLINSAAAAVGESETEEIRQQMARWIEQERERFDESGGNTSRFRKAEGIVAYLRAHDFSISKLVAALQKRSGASQIELVAIHLVDQAGQDSFKLKVVPVDAAIELGKQGFNVDIRSPDVTYLSAVYSLGLALYEIHEIINTDSPVDEAEVQDELEPLPLPDVRTTPSLGDARLPASSGIGSYFEGR